MPSYSKPYHRRGHEPFADKMKRLIGELQEHQAEGARLDAAITQNLKALGLWDGDA